MQRFGGYGSKWQKPMPKAGISAWSTSISGEEHLSDTVKPPAEPNDPQPPSTVGDGYLLPEYQSAFIKFVDDAQWQLIFEHAPIVKDAFCGEAAYAIPESFGRSVRTAGGGADSDMTIATSGVESDFTLTRDQVLSGSYTVFADRIAENLPRMLEVIVPAITKSMEAQGALVRFDHNANFWEQLLAWMEKTNLRFSDDGTVSLDHLRMFGQGDVRWIRNVQPTEEQIERWTSIIERQRTEYFAKKDQLRLAPNSQSGDEQQIRKVIQLLQKPEHERFVAQYATPEYERAQVGWIHGLAEYEIMRSPSLAAYHQLYIKLGMHEASSTGGPEGSMAYVPQKKLVVREVMPLADVIAGNYRKRYEAIRVQVEEIRPELVQEAVTAMESIEQARGAESGVAVIKDFNWDVYLERLEAMDLSFDALGTPILPVVSSANPEFMPMTEAQRERLESIITEKRTENDARRTSSRRLSK